jgi:hypothetical protein
MPVLAIGDYLTVAGKFVGQNEQAEKSLAVRFDKLNVAQGKDRVPGSAKLNVVKKVHEIMIEIAAPCPQSKAFFGRTRCAPFQSNKMKRKITKALSEFLP